MRGAQALWYGGVGWKGYIEGMGCLKVNLNGITETYGIKVRGRGWIMSWDSCLNLGNVLILRKPIGRRLT